MKNRNERFNSFEVKTNSNSAKDYLISTVQQFLAEPCIFLFNFCRIIDKTLIESFRNAQMPNLH